MTQSLHACAGCPCCDAPLVEINLGGELQLRSCSRCDQRWWSRGETPARLDQVLSTVAANDKSPKRNAA